MKTYKYTDATNTVVHIIDEDGISRMSMLASTLPEGNAPEPADLPTTEQIIAGFTGSIQARLDTFARTRGYDGILSAATYASSTNAQFATEGQYAVNARDLTWAKCYEILGAVQSGTRPMPTLAEIEAELPVLEWPL